ncbi:hypothetical protein [Mycobacterium antarcticum]|uniref:hypothetical protein n=1 Tax=Mycolicibacterium sp. TUM20983 TaxID=3023369 RepID=UPI0024E14A49|nr:hypothetical protein [Mycolicibacterium sp. TUM20983]
MSLIPMPVVGGLVLVIGAELVHGRWAAITLVLRTAPWSAVAMVVTFVATTELPLDQAILIGRSRRWCSTASRPRNRPASLH